MRLKVVALLGLFVCLNSCVTPSERIRAQAKSYAFEELELRGTDYRHVVFFKAGAGKNPRLHVYLEGDGSPWLDRDLISPDPTPKNPLMLSLMALDPNPALYLGRPCYMGIPQSDPCEAGLWTHRRYSAEVVASMSAALKQFLRIASYSELAFLGHSGGGALALLLAEQFPQTRAVVTLSGNLDTDAWTDYHGYERLVGSMNPANRNPLSPKVQELHYVGREDQNVLPRFVRSRLKTNPGIEVKVVNGFNHTCCWQEIWPEILERISQKQAASVQISVPTIPKP